MTEKLTKRLVDNLVAGTKDLVVWDSDVRGFGVKVTPKGTKSYFVILPHRQRPTEASIHR